MVSEIVVIPIIVYTNLFRAIMRQCAIIGSKRAVILTLEVPSLQKEWRCSCYPYLLTLNIAGIIRRLRSGTASRLDNVTHASQLSMAVLLTRMHVLGAVAGACSCLKIGVSVLTHKEINETGETDRGKEARNSVC